MDTAYRNLKIVLMNKLREEHKQQLQGCVQGYTVRQQLVHNLRKEYERVVEEVQSFEGRELLPLANEAIIWPRESTLCLPQFVPPDQLNGSFCVSTSVQEKQSVCDDLEHFDDRESVDLTSSGPPVHHTHQVPIIDYTHEDPLVDHTHQNPPANVLCEEVATDHPVFLDLPKSREGLVELRAQLAMELLWLKQAISSRQKYLMLKKQLTPNRPPPQ